MQKFPIYYWKFHDGVTAEGGLPSDPFIPAKGWTCWAYSNHIDLNLNEWMEKNMTGKWSCIFRFDGGNPFYEVYILEESDAMFFQLSFL